MEKLQIFLTLQVWIDHPLLAYTNGYQAIVMMKGHSFPSLHSTWREYNLRYSKTKRMSFDSHSNEAQIADYIQNVFIPGVTDDQISQLSALYPADVTAGSPFGTGLLNALTPQFKRIAAVQGDGVFQAPRRWLLKNSSGKQDIWIFCKSVIFE